MSVKIIKTRASVFFKIDSNTLTAFKKEKKIIGVSQNIFYKKNTEETPRLGIFIPKKTLSLAVLRNKLRRKIREDFKKDQKDLFSYDILVVIKQKINAPKINIDNIYIQEWKELKKSLSK